WRRCKGSPSSPCASSVLSSRRKLWTKGFTRSALGNRCCDGREAVVDAGVHHGRNGTHRPPSHCGTRPAPPRTGGAGAPGKRERVRGRRRPFPFLGRGCGNGERGCAPGGRISERPRGVSGRCPSRVDGGAGRGGGDGGP